jgi:N-acetylglucosaminyldiphosphoundecaprenol N-acetyl-beta-D-mannosaminyltransferase
MDYRCVLGMRVDATTYAEASATVVAWAAEGRPRYVCVANVHVTMETYDSPEFRRMVNAADMVVPDGTPLAWMLRFMGKKGQQRVYGPTLTLHLCEAAAAAGTPVGFLGGTPEALKGVTERMKTLYPALEVAYAFSPPFRPLEPGEHAQMMRELAASGARILFVGLGCPKQERWMAEHSREYRGVMLGVGAAFNFHAGTVRQAPAWVQRMGMEWAFRFLMEPRRLWKRYLLHNPRFVLFSAMQLLGLRKFTVQPPPPADRAQSVVDKSAKQG